MKSLLEIKNLKKNYHTPKEEIQAISDISFTLEEKEFLSIVGPSGCGKSTILSILSGICEKSDGEIQIQENKKIGYMLQEDSLLPFKTIFENCMLGLEIQKKDTEENKQYVLHLLNTYGLSEFLNSYPSSLSGGMRQRCALIRTLALKPDILLLDEATSALDYQSRLMISDDIYNIIKKEGKSAIMVTHDIAQAISMSDRILLLSKRPCTIKKIYKIHMDSPTPMDRRNTKEFLEYYEKIWRDLDVQI